MKTIGASVVRQKKPQGHLAVVTPSALPSSHVAPAGEILSAGTSFARTRETRPAAWEAWTRFATVASGAGAGLFVS